MRGLRLLRRLVLLTLVTLACLLILFLGALPAALLGRFGPWRVRVMSWWSRLLVAVIGCEIEVVGVRPEGGFLLVSNHLSYVDIPVLASCLPCTFVSKAEVRSWPVLGLLSWLAGTIYIDRNRRSDVVRVGAEIERELEKGRRVVFFPEGTSTGGASVQPFRSSLLEPAAAHGIAVRYAVLRYEAHAGMPPASVSVAWWGDMDFAPHILQLLSSPGFRARVEFGEEAIVDADRKALAQRLHRSISERFQPMEQVLESTPAARREAAAS